MEAMVRGLEMAYVKPFYGGLSFFGILGEI